MGRAHGFTLIEMLVVVLIIGLLAAVAAANVAGHLGESRVKVTKSQLGHLTARDRDANGVWHLLSRDAPRDDCPLVLPETAGS